MTARPFYNTSPEKITTYSFNTPRPKRQRTAPAPAEARPAMYVYSINPTLITNNRYMSAKQMLDELITAMPQVERALRFAWRRFSPAKMRQIHTLFVMNDSIVVPFDGQLNGADPYTLYPEVEAFAMPEGNKTNYLLFDALVRYYETNGKPQREILAINPSAAALAGEYTAESIEAFSRG